MTDIDELAWLRSEVRDLRSRLHAMQEKVDVHEMIMLEDAAPKPPVELTVALASVQRDNEVVRLDVDGQAVVAVLRRDAEAVDVHEVWSGIQRHVRDWAWPTVSVPGPRGPSDDRLSTG